MTIAILAMQGAFLEHGQMLDRLGVEHFEIRKKEDLNRHFDGLILPGGESTVMRKLLIELDIYDTLKQKIEDGLPVFGTCAGLILLAERVEDGVPCFGTMNILAKRNAYGRQLGSFYTEDEMKEIGKIPMTFIRAPYIDDVYGATIKSAWVSLNPFPRRISCFVLFSFVVPYISRGYFAVSSATIPLTFSMLSSL